MVRLRTLWVGLLLYEVLEELLIEVGVVIHLHAVLRGAVLPHGQHVSDDRQCAGSLRTLAASMEPKIRTFERSSCVLRTILSFSVITCFTCAPTDCMAPR